MAVLLSISAMRACASIWSKLGEKRTRNDHTMISFWTLQSETTAEVSSACQKIPAPTRLLEPKPLSAARASPGRSLPIWQHWYLHQSPRACHRSPPWRHEAVPDRNFQANVQHRQVPSQPLLMHMSMDSTAVQIGMWCSSAGRLIYEGTHRCRLHASGLAWCHQAACKQRCMRRKLF